MPDIVHRSFPRAILHVDGDSFFVACEIAKNPSLRGKPVVTGSERGIASAMSYEAKKVGITRAMKISDARRLCPGLIVIESDYEAYSLYSMRMYSIVRRYTEAVEEYSIDECFADLTGMRRPNNMSYEEMAERVKRELEGELGLSFSVGLSVSKVTAKAASNFRKPSGLAIMPGYDLPKYLAQIPVQKIWGIGPNTSAYLYKLGVKTAQDLAAKPDVWVAQHLSKPGYEIWRELNGESVMPLNVGHKHDYGSIQKTLTFRPPSADRSFLWSQLSRNIENACAKLRRHQLYAGRVSFFLKTQEFRFHSLELKLSRAACVPEEILAAIRDKFDLVHRPGVPYRTTGVIMSDLSHERAENLDLFGAAPLMAKVERTHEAIDRLDERYGRHTVYLGSSAKAMRQGDEEPSGTRLRGAGNKRIGLPFLGKAA